MSFPVLEWVMYNEIVTSILRGEASFSLSGFIDIEGDQSQFTVRKSPARRSKVTTQIKF